MICDEQPQPHSATFMSQTSTEKVQEPSAYCAKTYKHERFYHIHIQKCGFISSVYNIIELYVYRNFLLVQSCFISWNVF